MSERVVSACDFCGQQDDHPKVHLADGPTKHHDCLSAAEKAMISESSPVAARIIDACVRGKRGADLLAHIQSLHPENQE